MKIRTANGIKSKVVVSVGDEQGDATIVLYRGGRTGLAFRSPAHRILKDAARTRRTGEAMLSVASASAAISSQQGGSQ
ncbi:MAG: hypothetical protein H8K06_15730 [Nitrospira sp.]|uniref:Uncharacterized protein n=1 Tax=Nitrospira defluvii TaxID=330214 RepID=A0ABM8R1T8_9BACT|nr:hypothetical protein [Nitrospira defluvii]MCS6328515.1 hypothetical protein [Nitrospira sp.]CAE6727858.1 conserved hypothetical protein [Nitrospira defluvii]